jgi:methionyl-tRNA formyltransferase
MPKPSVILMGSKPGSVVALSIMLQRGWDVRAVVVSRKIVHPWVGGETLEQAAIRHGLPVMTQPELPRDMPVDFVISYMFRYRVKTDVIALGRRAAVNFHAGPLPEFGGWAFYNVAILENSPEYGCTCHYMDEGFDTGPLFKVRRFPIDAAKETGYSLERRSQQEMVKLFVDFCRIAECGNPLPKEEQDRSKMRYLTQEQFTALKVIPPNTDNETCQRVARAFWYPPYECAYIQHGPAKLEIMPNIAKDQLAELLHRDDLEDLRKVAQDYGSGN